MPEQFLNTKQVAERLAITEGTARVWMRSGFLPAKKDYHRGRPWIMTESALVKWMQEIRNGAKL